MSNRLFDASAYDPRVDEAAALRALGFGRIPMDLPWPIEPVNVTVVEGTSLALIDTGLRYGDNLARLTAALEAAGHALTDVDELWLTHPHIDHFGLTGELVALTGAKVFCWAPTKPRYHDYMTHWSADRAWVREAFAQAAVPEATLTKTFSTGSHYTTMGGPLQIDETFEEGEVVQIAGRAATALHVPGHSPWCTAFWFEDTQTLVSGDALLGRISSNPILYPPSVGPPTWQGLPTYQRSLKRLGALPAARVLPGHGRSFTGHEVIAERWIAGQSKRQQNVLQALHEGAETAVAVAEAVFGEARTHSSLFLVMSEILRHLDWLLEEALICRTRHGDHWRYEALLSTSSAA